MRKRLLALLLLLALLPAKPACAAVEDEDTAVRM